MYIDLSQTHIIGFLYVLQITIVLILFYSYLLLRNLHNTISNSEVNVYEHLKFTVISAQNDYEDYVLYSTKSYSMTPPLKWRVQTTMRVTDIVYISAW